MVADFGKFCQIAGLKISGIFDKMHLFLEPDE